MEALLAQPEGTLSVHTPETLGRAVQSAVAHALGSASWQLVQVSGIYRAKKTAPYGAYYYDRLEAEDNSTQLTLATRRVLAPNAVIAKRRTGKTRLSLSVSCAAIRLMPT